MTKVSSIVVLGLALGTTATLALAGCGDDDRPRGADAGSIGGDAGGGGDGGAGAPTCAEFCAVYGANCREANSEFASTMDCLNYCENVAGWQPGVRGATSGDTIACRIYHAGAPAASNAAEHCPHAGPSGAGVCGTSCEAYCELALKNCTGPNMLFADLPACLTACAMFPATGSPGDTSGDSVQCRIYHSGTPASENPGLHCAHAGVTGGGVCVAGGG